MADCHDNPGLGLVFTVLEAERCLRKRPGGSNMLVEGWKLHEVNVKFALNRSRLLGCLLSLPW